MKFHSLIAAALLCAASGSHAALIHQFDLNGSLNNSVGTETLQGNGELTANAYVFDANEGLRLDAQLGGVYTIDMAFHFDSFGNYGRILNFTNLVGDNGFYAQNHSFRVFGTTGPITGSNGHLAANVDSRVTLTRDAAKMFKVYQNGELVLSVSDPNNITDFGQNVAWFFRDNNGSNGGEAFPGAVDYIRIYSTALSADEVKVLAPLSTDVSEPATYGLLGAGLAMMGWTRRRRK